MDRKLIIYNLLRDFPQVIAFTTTKQTIKGEAKPRFSGKPGIKAERNRKELAEALNINSGQLVFPGQTHTSSVYCLEEVPPEEIMDKDALVTNQHGICLCVQTADCVPVLLFDPVRKAVAAIHAGWRGTTGLIAQNVVLTLKHRFNSKPEDIKAVIGPSIGPDKYEVGDEVVEAVLKNVPNPEHSLKKYSLEKYHFDLWEANRQILLDNGILSENIEVSGCCTYSEEETFFSARREGLETGRLVSGIMLL